MLWDLVLEVDSARREECDHGIDHHIDSDTSKSWAASGRLSKSIRQLNADLLQGSSLFHRILSIASHLSFDKIKPIPCVRKVFKPNLSAEFWGH